MSPKLAMAILVATTLTAPGAGASPAGETVSISGAWALYPLAVRWAEEFGKLNKNVHFDVSAGGAGKGMTDVLVGAADIGMVSRELSPTEVARGAVAVAVARDAVVPVVNDRNPVLAALQRHGLSRQASRGIWVTGETGAWEAALGVKSPAPLRAYTRSDACGAAETWARFLGAKQEELKGIGVYGDPGIAEAVRKDLVGIGYNNVNFAYDASTGRPLAGLAIAPIDVDGDGLVGADEDVYGNRATLLAAIGDGRYPSPPARDLYFVIKGRPTNAAVVAFLRWALRDGQRHVAESGYVALATARLEAQLSGAELAP